tara:strand:- start:10590 stop:11672 length:1083 start_codon:yes stop_codon:yes gene_type:complete
MTTNSLKEDNNLNYENIINLIPNPILLIDKFNKIVFVNFAGELFFGESAKLLKKKSLEGFLSSDSQLFAIVNQVKNQGYSATQYDITVNDINKKILLVDVVAGIYNDLIILSIHKKSIAQQIDRSIVQKNIHSVSGLSALMAHEIKNPLSGIKGAAQLLNEELKNEDRDLTKLIIDEVDRIGDLINKVGSLSDKNIISRSALNIHDVLRRVCKLAKNSFCKNSIIVEKYDPSLPEVYGDMNSLIQLFLNLIKNSSEAKSDGKITVETGYRHGFNIKVSGSKKRLRLPIYINIKDDGPGIPDNIKSHLFEPFVSSKHGGSGLGLSLVASIVEEHGGIIELNSVSGTTIFTVLLPSYEKEKL